MEPAMWFILVLARRDVAVNGKEAKGGYQAGR